MKINTGLVNVQWNAGMNLSRAGVTGPIGISLGLLTPPPPSASLLPVISEQTLASSQDSEARGNTLSTGQVRDILFYGQEVTQFGPFRVSGSLPEIVPPKVNNIYPGIVPGRQLSDIQSGIPVLRDPSMIIGPLCSDKIAELTRKFIKDNPIKPISLDDYAPGRGLPAPKIEYRYTALFPLIDVQIDPAVLKPLSTAQKIGQWFTDLGRVVRHPVAAIEGLRAGKSLADISWDIMVAQARAQLGSFKVTGPGQQPDESGDPSNEV